MGAPSTRSTSALPERLQVGDPRAHQVPVGQVGDRDTGRRLRHTGRVREHVGDGDAARVDPRRFPRIARTPALRTRGRDFDREFEYGLAVFVAGLRATAPGRPPTSG